jgi:hypothetical protein
VCKVGARRRPICWIKLGSKSKLLLFPFFLLMHTVLLCFDALYSGLLIRLSYLLLISAQWLWSLLSYWRAETLLHPTLGIF